MTQKQKKNLIRVLITLSLFLILFITSKVLDFDFERFSLKWLFELGIYLILYLYITYDVILKALNNIKTGQIFDENLLMLIATFGAFLISEYTEAIAVMIFYQFGEFFQSYAVDKSRKSISNLMDLRPDYANLVSGDEVSKVSPDEVSIGDTIRIFPGEKVPLDAKVIIGESSLDTKTLTGESIPKDVGVGDTILSGCVNLTSTIDLCVTKDFYDSTATKILDMIENANTNKSSQESFITRFARIYTPIVVTSALLLALIGSLITKNYDEWIYRALNFLVVSCPCALVISVPLSFFSGIGALSSKGVLVKGSTFMEEITKVNTFIFDKTGTLSEGVFEVTSVYPRDKEEEILMLASTAENESSHPIALSIKKAYKGKVLDGYTITNVAGKGIIAKNNNDIIYAGNYKLLSENGFKLESINSVGTIVYVARNNDYIGYIEISDKIRENSKELISYLKDTNHKAIMLTGDNNNVAGVVGKSLALDDIKGELLPQDKLQILNEEKEANKVAFVGDGINDALSLVSANVGISMGGIGSDAAIEASDIVLMHDDIGLIKKLLQVSRKTLRIVYENIYFAIGVKLLVLILSALGITNMWIAIFADVGVALISILNAMRAGRTK